MERTFDQLLDHLKGELLKMGGAVEESIDQAVRSLVDRDNDLAQTVIDGGKDIDDWEVKIEEECLRLLAMQQPVASDLRLIATTMKINYDLERVNDQAVNIAQRALVLNQLPMLKPLIDIPRMAELTRSMVNDALDAFVNRDVNLANKVRKIDDLVDGLRDQVFRELLTYLHGQTDTTMIDRAIQLILVSRHLERIGDHASNISENAVYLVQGRIVRHKKEELEDLEMEDTEV
ncbi:MAG: phosphate transport system regulatory protein PhoU [Gemmatimonadetes bacterium]|nr:phosphate transport system regulatory protein PhoU [Gemmatimonadota bacterium]|tara:strand:+ start:939 stop:1637 length:699 start_codon:yes stop_codon:yes gene_type:complete